jgi:glycosyltransferase involved in cell wall biosynthesis
VIRDRRPLHILMTTDAVGGIWQYTDHLARRLARVGHEITLAAIGPEPSAAQRLEVAAIDGVALRACPGKLEWMPDSEAEIDRIGDWLLALEDRRRPDVVHLNGLCHGALPWRTPSLVVAHSCVRSWWRACHWCDPPPEWNGYVRRAGDGLRGAGMVVAPTASFLAEMAALYGPFRQSRVIANGGERDRFPPLAKRPYAIGIGRIWDQAKNFDRLERIADRASWPIMLAGEAIDPTTGEDRTPCSAIYIGRLPQPVLARWLGHAGLFVHPALYEPFGLAALEAAYAGCALLLADIPTLRELWDGAAVFFDPRAEDELLSALNALAADPARIDALAAAARRRARDFGADRMAGEYDRAYRELLSSRAALGIAARRPADGRDRPLPQAAQQTH